MSVHSVLIYLRSRAVSHPFQPFRTMSLKQETAVLLVFVLRQNVSAIAWAQTANQRAEQTEAMCQNSWTWTQNRRGRQQEGQRTRRPSMNEANRHRLTLRWHKSWCPPASSWGHKNTRKPNYSPDMSLSERTQREWTDARRQQEVSDISWGKCMRETQQSFLGHSDKHTSAYMRIWRRTHTVMQVRQWWHNHNYTH